MTLETRFDMSRSLILIKGKLTGPRGNALLRLVLDTGASKTLIVPQIIDNVGYSPRDGEKMSSVTSAIGDEQGYVLRVARFATLGFAMADFPIHVFDLADRHSFDGLVGLNFLRWFNYEVRSAEGRILVSNLKPLAS